MIPNIPYESAVNDDISFDILANLHLEHGLSITTLIRQCMDHNMPSGKLQDGTLVIAAENIIKFHQWIKDGLHKPLTYLPHIPSSQTRQKGFRFEA